MAANNNRLRALLALLVGVALLLALSSGPAAGASSVLVTDVSPDGNATGVAADSNVTAKFNRVMRAGTINGSTFYLKREGSLSAIPATVSYSRTSKTANLNPEGNLEAGATYTAAVKGGKRGVRASDGGKLGGTKDSTATFASGKVTWSFTIANDSPPPPPPPPPPPTGVTVSPATLDLSFSGDCSLIPVITPYPNAWVTTTNNGPGDVTFAGASITGQDASYFSAGSVQYFANPANGPITVVPSDTLEDQVALHPDPAITNSTRTYSATLTYEDESGAEIAKANLAATTTCARLNF